jgi:hypothetical protein
MRGVRNCTLKRMHGRTSQYDVHQWKKGGHITRHIPLTKLIIAIMCNIIACTLDKEEFVGIVRFPIPRPIDQKRPKRRQHVGSTQQVLVVGRACAAIGDGPSKWNWCMRAPPVLLEYELRFTGYYVQGTGRWERCVSLFSLLLLALPAGWRVRYWVLPNE